MDVSDIYSTKAKPNQSRRKHQAVSQRRDEYLRATGGEALHNRHHHRNHEPHRRSSGWKVLLAGLGVLILLAAGALWWLMSRR